MARAGANGLSTITNHEKMANEIPVHEPSSGLAKPPQATCRVSPARVRLITSKPTHWALHVPPKNNMMDINKIQNPA